MSLLELKNRMPTWLLGLFAAFNLSAIMGFASFGLHPELLQRFPGALSFYTKSFVIFSQGQIALSALMLMAVLTLWSKGRWLLALVGVYAVSLLSEYAGTNYGVPFGAYHYSELLGPKIGGHVPYLIPLSWFTLGVPCYALALSFLPEGSGRFLKYFVGAWLLASWDIALDPAMSFLTPYWIWADPGLFYGMPAVNLLGWFVTAFAIMATMDLLGIEGVLERVPGSWMTWFYALNVVLPLGMCIAAGLWMVPVALVAALLAICAVVVASNPGILKRAVL